MRCLLAQPPQVIPSCTNTNGRIIFALRAGDLLFCSGYTRWSCTIYSYTLNHCKGLYCIFKIQLWHICDKTLHKNDSSGKKPIQSFNQVFAILHWTTSYGRCNDVWAEMFRGLKSGQNIKVHNSDHGHRKRTQYISKQTFYVLLTSVWCMQRLAILIKMFARNYLYRLHNTWATRHIKIDTVNVSRSAFP